MRKLFLLLIATVSVLQVSAQEEDSLHNQTIDGSLDSLILRLNKLQHDYDFMNCDYELHKLIMDLKDLSNTINISANEVVINYYNTNYDRALYFAYSRNYDSKAALSDSMKKKSEVVRLAVMYKIASSDFSDEELGVLNASLDVIKHAIINVESALNYYATAIKAYKRIM